MKKKSVLYTIIRPLIVFYTKVFLNPTYIGLENIPESGRIILAGNHTNNYDCIALMTATKRQVHFLAKKELFEGLFGFFFKHLGLIPVDRKGHSIDAFGPAIEYLNAEELIGIFPEGTYPKNGEILLPFKKGACKMAYESDSLIVPFVIKGKYGFRSKNLTIEFLKPIKVKSDKYKAETEKLRNIILEHKER